MTREVFKPAEDQPSDPGGVFYTITSDDVGHSTIKTTAGVICLSDFFGRVQRGDVGKRLYRAQNNAKNSWVWQAENDAQRDARLRAGDAWGS